MDFKYKLWECGGMLYITNMSGILMYYKRLKQKDWKMSYDIPAMDLDPLKYDYRDLTEEDLFAELL